jgi:hypothetical protein
MFCKINCYKADQQAKQLTEHKFFATKRNLLTKQAFPQIQTQTPMKKLLQHGICICLALFFTNALFAQVLPSIGGSVIDKNKKPAAGASVSLLHAKDSSVVTVLAADDNAKFSFPQVKEGKYIISIEVIGFKKYYSAVLLVTNQNIILPTVQLQEASGDLAAVTVSSTKSFTEQKIDRTVVNVDALISNTGSNALEVLEKTPGVIVDENGNITFKGKTGVLILIDDKPTYMSAADLAAYLRSLPSSQLDKIELMDNPPAKYDASGNGGVINIKTKKSKAKGFNGSLSASYGQSFYARSNYNLNLNYHVGKINVFGSIGYNTYKNFRELKIDRDYYDAGGHLTNAFRQRNIFVAPGSNWNAKIGFDYASSSNTSLGFVYTGTRSKRSEVRPTLSLLYNAAGSMDSSIQADNGSTSTFEKDGLNFNYTHKFDSLGKVLSFDMDYINYRSGADQYFFSGTYSSAGSLKSRQDITAQLPSNISIYAAKMDYSQPLPGKAKFEAGLKTSYVTSDNEANYFNITNGAPVVDYSNTNHFIYKENINAAYINFTKEFSRLTLQAGLRLENTNGNGHQLGNLFRADSAFTKHYTSLFPTAYLSYKLDSAGNDLFNFAYGRRIDRPNYQDLNPFVFILDKFTAFAGNPFLRPQFSNDFKLSFNHKNKFTLSGQYIHTSDIQIETIQQNGNIFISRNGNIGQWNYYLVSLETTLHPAKWWSLYTYTDFFNYQVYTGVLPSGGSIETKSIYLFTQLNNQLTLGNGWSAELGGFYCSPRQQAQFDKIAFGQLNAGVQKKFWNNKATVKLSARDIFNTNTSTGNITNVPNVALHYQNRFYNQTVTLGFTYSFGTQSSEQKRKIGSADSESGRAGN